MYNPSTDPATRSSTSDSWIEIPSRPSSSMSSAADEAMIPSSGIVRRDANRRRGRLVEASPLRLNLAQRTSSVGGSSQEEYEESESESDRVMTSSNEGLHSSASESGNEPIHILLDVEAEAEDEDDENGTALGIGRALSEPSVFTPQPNAFTHPPSSSSQSRHRSAVPGSYFPSSTRSNQRHSYPNQPTRQPMTSHSPFTALSPSHLPDHDAVLRASLNTLLSCAAAARKKSDTRNQPPPATSNRIEASTLRLVPEYVALGLERPTLQTRRISSTPSSSQRASSPAFEAVTEKRKAVRSSSKERTRIAKKQRRGVQVLDEITSPTLLTWVVSAGVLVLVSALSFTAGYKVGRESVGLEGASEGVGCAREAARGGLGLRRLHGGAVRV